MPAAQYGARLTTSCGGTSGISGAARTSATCFTMLLNAPGPLILISAVIGFAGTVIFPAALYLLNHRILAAALPEWARPRPVERWLLAISFVAYLALAAAYLWQTFGR